MCICQHTFLKHIPIPGFGSSHLHIIPNLSHIWPIPGGDFAQQGGAPSLYDVLHGAAQGIPDGNGNGTKGGGKAKAKAKAKSQPGGKGNTNGENNAQPESIEPTAPLQKAKTLARSVLLGCSVHYVFRFSFHHTYSKNDHTIFDDLEFHKTCTGDSGDELSEMGNTMVMTAWGISHSNS